MDTIYLDSVLRELGQNNNTSMIPVNKHTNKLIPRSNYSIIKSIKYNGYYNNYFSVFLYDAPAPVFILVSFKPTYNITNIKVCNNTYDCITFNTEGKINSWLFYIPNDFFKLNIDFKFSNPPPNWKKIQAEVILLIKKIILYCLILIK